MTSMNIKKGDNVVVITGKDLGKKGKILSVLLSKDRVLVEGVNLYKKHRRPRRQGEKGEVITVPRSLHASNVQLYCSSCARGVRTGYRFEGKTKLRHCKRCNVAL
jgi:large subunit ribosomal protein L24